MAQAPHLRQELRRETSNLLQIAAPLFIAQLAQMGTGVVDTIMAGRYGTLDLAAIAIGYNIWLPVYLIPLGIMMAVTVIVAQHFGAKRIEEIRAVMPQATWLALILGLLTVPICLFPTPILDQLSLEPESYAKSRDYLWALAWGLPGAALFQVFRSHIQGVGIVRPFAIAAVIGFFANIPLNYIFIYGYGIIPEMGAAGCGWATAIAMWLGPLLIILFTLRAPELRLYLPEFRWHAPQRKIIGEILHLGYPIALTFFFEMAVFSVISLLIATHGTITMASHQIAFNIYDVVYIPLIAIGSAMATRMGHAIGAGDRHGMRISLMCASLWALLFVLLTIPALTWLPDYVTRIYTEDLAIRELASTLLKLTALFIMIDLFAIMPSFALRAFKDTRYPFLVMAVAYWMVALPVGYYLGSMDPASDWHGALGYWIGMITGIAVAALLTLGRLWVFMHRPLPAVSPDSVDSSLSA